MHDRYSSDIFNLSDIDDLSITPTADNSVLQYNLATGLWEATLTPSGLTSLGVTGTGTFGQIIDNGLTASKVVFTDGSKQLTSTATWPGSGQFGYWDRTSTTLSPANSGDALDMGTGNITTTGRASIGSIIYDATGINANAVGFLYFRAPSFRFFDNDIGGNVTITFGDGDVSSDTLIYTQHVSDPSFAFSALGSFPNLDVDTLNLNGNVISDSTGTISFDDENIITTGDVDIGASANGTFLVTGTTAISGDYVNVADSSGIARLVVQGTIPIINMIETDGTANKRILALALNGDNFLWILSNDNLSTKKTVATISMTDGNVVWDADWTITGDLTFNTSADSSSTADEVSLGGYELSAGNRALAISQEAAVAVEVDETKFSHKLPVRINGSTYYIMLTAT